jgi:PAS domain S-box-containing protein
MSDFENNGRVPAQKALEDHSKEHAATWLTKRLSPVGLLIITAISVFSAELAVMFFLNNVPTLSQLTEAVIDASLLTALVFPLFYILLFRPLRTQTTGRKEVEQTLTTTRARLQHLLSSGPAVIYTCEPYSPFAATFISENVKGQMGYEPRDFVIDPKFWANHIHPDDVQRVLKDLQRLFKQGHHIHEYRFRSKDGTYRWMLDELRLVRDAEGKVMEIVGYWTPNGSPTWPPSWRHPGGVGICQVLPRRSLTSERS